MTFEGNSLNFLITFPEKPRHETKKIAIKIAEECNFEIKDGSYYVYFHTIDQKFLKLLNLTRGWSTSNFIVDNGKADSSEVRKILFCHLFDNCSGICERVKLIPYYNLSFFVYRLKNYFDGGFIGNSRSIEGEIMNSGYISKTDDPTTYTINKKKILEEVKSQIKDALIYCEKINEKTCLDLIESLPNQIKIRSHEQHVQTDDKDENEFDDQFEGYSESEKKQIREEAEIKAPIYAKAIAEELDVLFKKYLKN